MAYKKKFTGPNTSGTMSTISGAATGNWNDGNKPANTNDFAFRNYQSRLPEVYVGHPNRVERYNSYEQMDCDPEVNSCLDILAEFSTQINEHNRTPFDINFNGEPTQTEVDLVSKQLQQWCKLNEFSTRIFKIFRNTVKYGDQVFVRDPETFKLTWVDMTKVVKVIVNESEGKEPEQYVIRDININLQNLTIAPKTTTDFAVTGAMGHGGTGGGSGNSQGYSVPSANQTSGGRFNLAMTESAIDARHIVHVSLTEGLDRFWPFGQSVLENIFKVFKQKELLEDAILIYRVQRAPERRVFKIDVGNMPSNQAMSFVNRIKDEIHQRRIPSITGGGSVVDATYAALSTNEDYYFPVNSEGRGSSVEMLNGGCFSMDTQVSLLDGRELSIADIAAEMAEGKELWTYSCEPLTGRVVPGLISWAGVTQKSARVMKITLDNGEYIICTPEHKFPVYEQEFKRADEFKIGDSMIPLYRKTEAIGEQRSDYEQFFDNDTGEWKYTHRVEVAAIEYLDDPIEVGTLTIDGDEIYHDYHTFALSVGVFTKNSNLGEIDDLKYFNNRLARGLRIPSSYLPTGPEDNQVPLSDGRVGTAMIQEYRFNQYCERLQGYISRKLNEEFKLFLRWRGFNIDASLFDITLTAPQNFASYRQAELDNSRVGTFQTMAALPYMSVRFCMDRFLGLSEEEIKKNQTLWAEERDEPEEDGAKGSDLRSIGISTSDIEGDLGMADEMGDADMGDEGMDDMGMTPPVAPPAGGGPGTAPPPGGPAAPA